MRFRETRPHIWPRARARVVAVAGAVAVTVAGTRTGT